MEIYDRIAYVRKQLKLSRREFGAKLGVSESVIVNIEMNRLSRPEQKKPLYNLICSTFNVDPYWLETGKGEMFLKMNEEDELIAYAESLIKNKDLDWIRQLILTLKNMSPEELDVMEKFTRSWLEKKQPKEKEQDN